MSALTIANPTDWPLHLKPHQHQLTEALIFINTSANSAAIQPLILKAVKNIIKVISGSHHQ